MIQGRRNLATASAPRGAKALIAREVPRTQAEVLSRWHLLPICELVNLPYFEPDCPWIAERMQGPVAADEYDFLRVLALHQETLQMWASRLDGLKADERELGLLNIPVSARRLPELKRRIRAFQDEIIGWLQDEIEPDQVVQLGTYLVPLTRARKPS